MDISIDSYYQIDNVSFWCISSFRFLYQRRPKSNRDPHAKAPSAGPCWDRVQTSVSEDFVCCSWNGFSTGSWTITQIGNQTNNSKFMYISFIYWYLYPSIYSLTKRSFKGFLLSHYRWCNVIRPQRFPQLGPPWFPQIHNFPTSPQFSIFQFLLKNRF